MPCYNFTDDLEPGLAAEALTKRRADFIGRANLQHSDTNAYDFNGEPGSHTRVLLVRLPKFAAWSVKLE